MATIGSLAVANDIASAALEFYIRGDALLQTIQDRPLLRFLNQGKETFPGGKQYINEPVQGAFMSDTAGFFAGYTQDDALTFAQAANLLRANFAWKEVHAGFVITATELKQDGISLTDGAGTSTSEHSDVAMTRLTGILKNRVADYTESWSRSMNSMLWADGTQDAKQVPGVLALLLDDPTAGTVGGLAQATYTWWRSRSSLALVPSEENQTLTKFLRNEVRQLSRYGGKPNKVLAGSAFMDALEQEVQKKGEYSTSGFTRGTDVGMGAISVRGIGTVEYDPTLDSLGRSKYAYVFDSRRIKMRPMEGEENKILEPTRPYNYMIMLRSMTNTLGLEVTQLNGMAVYAVQ